MDPVCLSVHRLLLRTVSFFPLFPRFSGTRRLVLSAPKVAWTSLLERLRSGCGQERAPFERSIGSLPRTEQDLILPADAIPYALAWADIPRSPRTAHSLRQPPRKRPGLDRRKMRGILVFCDGGPKADIPESPVTGGTSPRR